MIHGQDTTIGQAMARADRMIDELKEQNVRNLVDLAATEGWVLSEFDAWLRVLEQQFDAARETHRRHIVQQFRRGGET